MVFRFCCEDTFHFWRKWCDSHPPSFHCHMSTLASCERSVNDCVCVPVYLHTFSTAHSLCEITSRPLLRVCDHTTEKQLLNTDLTTPSNMSLVKRCWAQNNTLIRGNSQVNENEPLIYQTDIWCNISAVVNNWNSWKSPLRNCWQVARRLRVQKPQSGVVDTPIFLHLLRCSAPRSG